MKFSLRGFLASSYILSICLLTPTAHGLTEDKGEYGERNNSDANEVRDALSQRFFFLTGDGEFESINRMAERAMTYGGAESSGAESSGTECSDAANSSFAMR